MLVAMVDPEKGMAIIVDQEKDRATVVDPEKGKAKKQYSFL